MKSIKNKVILLMTILIIVPILIVSSLSYYYSSQNLKSHLVASEIDLAKSVSTSVTSFIDKAYTLSEEMANGKTVVDFVANDQKELLESSAKRNTYFDLLYIQKTDGNQTARSTGSLGNRASRWWFTQMMSEKKSFVSNSYYSVSTNTPVTSIFFPINDKSNNMLGIFGADLKLDELQRIVDSYSTTGSYAFIIDSEGVVIAHPDKTQVSELYNYKALNKTVLIKDSTGKVITDESGNQKTEVKDIKIVDELKSAALQALEGKSGTVEYTDNKEKFISAYSPIKIPGSSKDWAVITVEQESISMASIAAIQKKSALTTVIILAIIVILLYFVISKITAPIINITNLMKKAANGDLTVNSSHTSKDELGILSSEFNKMIANIRVLILKIKESSAVVSNSSNTFVATISETTKSIEEVASGIVNVATSANDQVDSVEEGFKVTSELSEDIEHIVSNIKESMKLTDMVSDVNRHGLDAIGLLDAKSEENINVIKNISLVMNDLNKKAGNINNIVNTITSISSQINLLALNAAIEAARAGEAGRGFNVVADEVRKLSISTDEATTEVKAIVDSIQKDILESIKISSKLEVIVKEQDDAVSYTKDSFKNIESSVENIIEQIHGINKGLSTVIQSRDAVTSLMKDIASSSENLSSTSEEVSATTEEQTAAMEQINQLAVSLNNMAQTLDDAVSSFKLD
jgi:methyl-accepting chemotaxis protein